LKNVGDVGGSKFRPSDSLGTSLIQQLVATAQAVMGAPYNFFSKVGQKLALIVAN